MKILTVCSGNQYRSVVMEAVWKKHYPQHYYQSCGTGAHAARHHGINSRIIGHLLRQGYQYDKRQSDPITLRLVEWADLILCASGVHVSKVKGFHRDNAVIIGVYKLKVMERLIDPGTKQVDEKDEACRMLIEQVERHLMDPVEIINEARLQAASN